MPTFDYGRTVVDMVTGKVLYEPSDKQIAYHTTTKRRPLFGGSKGCGKSICQRFDHYGPSIQVPNFNSLILRRTNEELRRSHLVNVQAEIAHFGDACLGYKSSDVGAGVVHFRNGSRIEFGHCQHENDVAKYLSAEYDRISFDEMVTFSERQFVQIATACRTTKPNVIDRVGGATNPGGKAARWVKSRWVDKDTDPYEFAGYRADDYEYIPALPTDNKYLNWEQYQITLADLPPELRKAYQEGSWDIFEGQFFPEFSRTRHVIDDVDRWRPQPPEIPRILGIDWGYAAEGVCLWAVVTVDGHLEIEDEYIFNGKGRQKQIVREVAAEIVMRNRGGGWRDGRSLTLRRVFGDPAMDYQSGHESVDTHMDTFRRNGVPVTRADNDRVNGWARLRAWLRNHPDGTPFLRIHPRCTYLTRTFSEMVMDDDRPEDMDTTGRDHALDALRYIVAGNPAPDTGRPLITLPPGSVGDLRRRSLAAQSTSRIIGRSSVSRSRRFAY